MQKFELFMCCMGNGITCCNKAVKEYGDYKTVAHISEHGHIKYYMDEKNIPDDVRKRIEDAAKREKEKFIENVWKHKTVSEKVEYILDIPAIGNGGINGFYWLWMNSKHLPLTVRYMMLEEKFFQTHM